MSADNIAVGAGSARKVQIWLLIGGGVVAAAQIGKAMISMPMIRIDMAFGLGLAGLIAATFATLGAFFGLGAGVLVRRSGVRRSLIVGMGAIMIGNLIGAAAPNEVVWLIARVIEGAGFFATVLAIPSMLARIVTGDERDFVMAMWSAYMPAGIMLMLLVGPLVPIIGWRNLWVTNALVAGACGVLLAIRAPSLTGAVLAEPTESFFSDVAHRPQSPLPDARACVLCLLMHDVLARLCPAGAPHVAE
jgi:MFS transporter, DHA1 family, inner membrane transport protein